MPTEPIQAGPLDLAGGRFTKLRARVIWEGTDVRFTGLETQFGEAAVQGSGDDSSRGAAARLRGAGKLTGLPWRSGTLSADGTLSTSGTGTALLGNMRAQGSFDGREIDLAAPDTYDSVTGRSNGPGTPAIRSCSCRNW